MIQGGSTIVKGSDSGTLRIVAVDSNGNLIALFQGYDGSAYVPVLVDSTGKIIAVIQGSESVDVKQKATGELIAEIQGSEGLAVKQKATTGELITKIQGSQDVDVKQEATGELITTVQGSQGLDVAQKAVTGELITEIVGSTGNAVAQDGSDKLITVVQGSQGIAVAQNAITGKLVAEIQGDNGVAVAQDGSNRLEAALYGDTGLVAQDASLRIQAAMYGSNGLIAQDASNRLIAAMVGSTGNPISQDANDALECVMKGNYAGTLKTWKVDTDGRGEMFISDESDFWGNNIKIGLSELSVRLGSPSIFDRRGSILYYDTFNDYPLKWDTTFGLTGGGTGHSATLSNERPFQHEGCLKVIPPNVTNDYTKLIRKIGGKAKGLMGFEATIFFKDSMNVKVSINISAFTGSKIISAGLRIHNNKLYYLKTTTPQLDSSWTEFSPSLTLLTYVYYPLKFVIDIDNEKYVRCLFAGHEIDMSAYSPYAGPLNYSQHIQPSIYVVSDYAGNPEIFIDNIILTTEEPA